MELTPLQTPVKYWKTRRERELEDNLAELYAIIQTVEHLEKAYSKDYVTREDYLASCNKLVTQFNTMWLVVKDQPEIESFLSMVDCPAAKHRLFVKGPDETSVVGAAVVSPKLVAETVQHFITLMDALKLNLTAVDHVHPLLGELAQSLTQIAVSAKNDAVVSQGVTGSLDRIREWLIELNKMRASDELDPEQVRQLLFDLENAHASFYRSLSAT